MTDLDVIFKAYEQLHRDMVALGLTAGDQLKRLGPNATLSAAEIHRRCITAIEKSQLLLELVK